VAGIGFLGAGSIIKGDAEEDTKGLTTAAGMWLTVAIGIAAEWDCTRSQCYGGTVTVTSKELGYGNEFTVRLPIEIEQKRLESLVQPRVAALSKSARRRTMWL